MPSSTHSEAEKEGEAPRKKAVPELRRADAARDAGTSDEHRRRLQRLEDSASATERGAFLRSLQRSHGNQYVQRLLASGEGTSPRLAAPPPGGGRPLETPVQLDMEDRLGAPLSGVRVHTDPAANEAAQALRARAFTSGQDVYFAGGAYQPSTAAGQALLAHELTHTLQQRGTTPGTMAELAVAPPDDPLEREAERVAEQVARGGHADVPSRSGSAAPARLIHRQAADAPAPAPGDPEADFVIQLGAGLKIKRADLKAAQRKGRYEKDLSAMSLPGLKVKRLVLNLDRETGAVRKGDVGAVLDVPFVRLVGRDDTRFEIDEQGKTSFRAKAKLAVPAIGSPVIDVALSEGAISGSATLTAEKLKPSGIPKLKVPSASVSVGLAEGKLTGKGEAALEYPGLARGDFAVEFKDGRPSGKGKIDLTPDYLKGVQAGLEIAEGNLQGELTVPAAKLSPPVPGLKITEGTLTVGMKNGQLSGAGEGIKFAYQSLGDGTIGFTIKRDRLEGAGSLNLTIPGLTPVKGELRYRDGGLSGQATITADKFPKGLPVKGGRITVLVDEKGAIAGRGAVRVDLFGVGEGELKLGYEKGILDVAAEVALRKIPGLEEGRVLISLKDGKLGGEGTIAVAPKQIPGLAGSLTVVYKEDRFSGNGKIGYAKGKLAGSVELFVAQDEKGKLAMSGSGEVTARLTDWLTGMVHIDVYPDTKTKIAGQLKADDVKLFPEKKADRELFNVSKNIPLWAILVAVIRARGGVRAGVGPGLLRGVTADGTFSTAEGEEPTFSIRGELFIPGYAEAYLAFGVGLGLDVLIGELTGGIEAVATAGIYGAVSVIPVIEYDGTDFSISGTATLAAGAKVKLGLQAWAEVEALWITVWENTWHLAEWVWDVGPTLAMQANVKYVFGRPEAPSFDFKTSDIDAERLVTDAMPKDGPRGSGARDALKNSSEWKGLLKEQRKDPNLIPPELAEKSAKAPVPKAPPPKKARRAPPPEALKDPAKAKEAALKELKAKDGAAPTKPVDKSHEEKLNKGMLALEKLRIKSETDPEDPDEIARHLAQIKAEHGFTKISYELKGEEWIIDAEMSPGRRSRARAQRDPVKEGLAGTYASLQGPSGDRMTPDHEPQHGLMSYISDQLRFQRRKPFKDTSVADYSHGRGICLNMFQDRHYQTRTYGTPGVKAAAVGRIRDAIDELDEDATDKQVQRKVAKVMNEELSADHQKVRDIYRNSRLEQSTKDRVNTGLSQVKSLNRATYFAAFDE